MEHYLTKIVEYFLFVLFVCFLFCLFVFYSLRFTISASVGYYDMVRCVTLTWFSGLL